MYENQFLSNNNTHGSQSWWLYIQQRWQRGLDLIQRSIWKRHRSQRGRDNGISERNWLLCDGILFFDFIGITQGLHLKDVKAYKDGMVELSYEIKNTTWNINLISGVKEPLYVGKMQYIIQLVLLLWMSVSIQCWLSISENEQKRIEFQHVSIACGYKIKEYVCLKITRQAWNTIKDTEAKIFLNYLIYL